MRDEAPLRAMPMGTRSNEAPPASLSIVFVDSVPQWGGGQEWAVRTALDLRRRGHAVCVLAAKGSELARRAAERGAEVRAERIGGAAGLARSGLLVDLVRERAADVVVATQGRDLRLAALAKLSTGVAIVQRRGLERPLGRDPVSRLVYGRSVDRVVANCAAIRARMIDGATFVDPARFVVVPNGVDLARGSRGDRPRTRRELGIGADEVLFGSLARLAPMKGHDVLLRAFARVAPALPAARLVVAGTGPEEARLRALHRELRLDERVTFLGFRTDLDDLHAALDVLVLASTRDEGCNHTLLESMAHARPAVVTDVGGLPEQVEHGASGLVVPRADDAALASALLALGRDPELRERFGSRAREIAVERYDAHVVAAAWERLFLELRAERGARPR